MNGIGSKRPRILLAEDDKSIAEVVTLLLQDNYEVITPNDFTDLEICISDYEFDLVLLDVSLWGQDCVRTSKEIREKQNNKNIPIILLSARSDVRIIAKTIGAREVIEKPFEINLLLKTVAKYLTSGSV